MTTPRPNTEAMLQIHNPADGSFIGEVPNTSADEVRAVVHRARKTFDDGTWSRRSPRDRAQVLMRLADLMERDSET